MGCNCKEKNQRDSSYIHLDSKLLSFNVGTSPIEGCLYCAEKHLSTAAALARELGYIPINRGYVIGEIVAACWHLNGTKINKAIELADKLREFRHKIQSRLDDKSCEDFSEYLKEIDQLIVESKDFERKQNDSNLEIKSTINKFNNLIDIIVPLGTESKSNDDELKLFLRSLEKNATNYNKVWIVATKKPEWLKENDKLEVLYKDDTYKHNKDANLFEKVKYAMEKSTADTVVFSADDCAILQNYNLSLLPPIYNKRGIKEFENNDSKWRRRMFATLNELNMTNGNFDTHTPQPFDRIKALKIIDTIPYDTKEGRCIDTAILGRIYNSSIPKEAVEQNQVKITAESKNIENLKFDKLFIGYNDEAFLNGLREKLFKLFPTPSQWENKEQDIKPINFSNNKSQKLIAILQIKSHNKADFDVWIKWYTQFIKCDEIHIVDDESSFNLNEIIEKYNENKNIFYHNRNLFIKSKMPGRHLQVKIYNDIINICKPNKNDIIIIPDFDEFWWFDKNKFNSFKDCVNSYREKFNNTNTICVSWTLMRSKEILEEREENQNYIEAFQYRTDVEKCECKPIIFYNGDFISSQHTGYGNESRLTKKCNGVMTTCDYNLPLRCYHFRFTTKQEYQTKSIITHGKLKSKGKKRKYLNQEEFTPQIIHGVDQNGNYDILDLTLYNELNNIRL